MQVRGSIFWNLEPCCTVRFDVLRRPLGWKRNPAVSECVLKRINNGGLGIWGKRVRPEPCGADEAGSRLVGCTSSQIADVQ